MTCAYVAADPVEAEIIRGLLAADRIQSYVIGDLLWGGRGEIGADPYPRVMLHDARDLARARELIDEYARARHQPQAAWTCDCGESVPGNFAACWSCGAVPA
jgi:hypothetical protein